MLKVRFRSQESVYSGTVRDDGYYSNGRRFDPEAVELLPPCEPSKVLAAGMNYGEHVEAITGEDFPKPDFPTLFPKLRSSLIVHEEPIVKHETVNFLDYEGEVAVVIGAECSDVSQDEALEYVAGYTGFNDVSSRDWLDREHFMSRGKSIDTFGPIGPYLETELDEPISVETRVNGEVRQQSDTSDLFFPIEELIATASEFFTLHPGDVIATGTPPGTASEDISYEDWGTDTTPLALEPGDVVEVTAGNAGTLRNEVVAPE
ncbi:fumarylacetoacetate hydrolase family protein [Halostagnicola sp. A-GB9-2]|uniref:fumarylacetoacetate hydrolase family protein n=1 Tax=Halostagnicola sp. A-GB9-2 TaxID=3048066 RepID=UPI0024BFBE16|nr:fumarylacetoacetate hydrolase family protein [Halostagnicola sp. A-GB9-2]MDJ1433834.1 fumarylacetoacetate hydrolase family protein [Halostagnicola sp. A-GB9-2]